MAPDVDAHRLLYRTNVALHGMYVGDTCSTEFVLGLLQHVLAIVQTGDVGLLHLSVLLRGKYSRTDRHIEQPPLEVIGNPTQYPAGNLVVIDTAPK